MRRLVYFDSNIFGHSYSTTGGITQAQVDQLKAAVADEKVSIVFSGLNFEEIIAVLGADGDNTKEAAQLTKLALELVDRQKIVKEPKRLLTDDIIAYAATGTAGDPFYSGPELSVVQENIPKVLMDFRDGNISELLAIIKDTNKQIGAFQSGMEKGKDKFISQYKALKKKGVKSKPTFDEFWDRQAEPFAESFADRVGALPACKKRGITGLLEIPSVRIALGVTLSHIYAQWFEGHNPRPSDSRDMLHAAAAAAATKTFVTHDGRLLRHVSRVPMADFRVMNLAGLLDELRHENV